MEVWESVENDAAGSMRLRSNIAMVLEASIKLRLDEKGAKKNNTFYFQVDIFEKDLYSAIQLLPVTKRRTFEK